MKIAALYCVHGAERWLPVSFRSVYGAVDRICFFVSRKRWYAPPADNTPLFKMIADLPDPERKIAVEEGDWAAETEQRNFSLAWAQFNGADYGMIVDADEVYDSAQLAAALQFAAGQAEVDCWHVRWTTYWKSVKYRIDPPEPYDPPMLVKLGSCGFIETRNTAAARRALIPPQICVCHHLSYVRSDEEIRQKHIFFPGHTQSMRPGWYEKVWLAWDCDHNLTDLHPVNPPQFKRAVFQPREARPPLLREL